MKRKALPLHVRRTFLFLVSTVAIVFVSSLLFMIFQGRKGLSDERTVLAVLPIYSELVKDSPDRYEGFAEGLAAYFGRADPQILGVLGPASTDRYAGQGMGALDIGNEVLADLIVTGREQGTEADPILLVELLQVSDASILWKREFMIGENLDLQDLLVEVSTQVTSVLDLPR